MKNKRESGITLIALVVTIVILLILAGISINAIMGDDGILKRTQDTGEKWQKAKEHDDEEVERVSDYLTSVEVNEAYSAESESNKGKKLICVYTDLTDVWYTYNGINMFDISDSGYAYKGLGYKKVFGIFIDNDEEYSRSNIKRVSSESVTNGIKIDYSGDKYDVNKSESVDLRDPVAVTAVMNSEASYFNEYVEICFRADVNRDKKVDEEDIKIVEDEYKKNS